MALVWPRIVLHADMDAFFAAVEQRDNPALRGRPVVIGVRSPRGVVSTCSYEARRFGIHSAMPMVRALELCPHAEVVSPRMRRYKAVSDTIMAVFDEFSPLVEPLSIDEAFIDMTGSTGIFGPPEDMARRLKAAVREATDGLTASVGIATTKFVAKVASDLRKPDGLTIVPSEAVREFLSPLPVSRIWGVGPKTVAQLEDRGLRRIGDVAALTSEAMEQAFGGRGAHIWRLANGVDDREVTPDHETKSIGREQTLEKDITGFDAIWPLLMQSADHVARALRREGLLARGVRVKLKTAGFKLITRQGMTSRATSSASDLLETARDLILKFDLSLDYRLVGMAATDLVREEPQGDLFVPRHVKKRRELDTAVDRVLEKYGDGALGRGSFLSPHGQDDDQ